MVEDHGSLVESAGSGDQPAMESLLKRHYPSLVAYLRLRAGKSVQARESCSDLAQSVCKEVLLDLGKFEYRGEAEFKNWLFTKAHHKILDRVKFYKAERRDAKREVQPPSNTEGDEPLYAAAYITLTPSRVVRRREELEIVEELFCELPPDHQEIILQSRIIGLSHAEIARQMNRTVEATRALLHRAVVRLSWLMTKRLGESESGT